MNRCYLSLGSNQKHPKKQIYRAFDALKRIPKTHLICVSNLYQTRAWGHTAQQDFCNAVAEIHTLLPPHSLLSYCQTIESNHGRIRKKHWGPRTLDIDILLYANQRINSHILTIPHRFMHLREFVLQPLSELNPSLVQQILNHP
jgi:2-amino-4-hydroxy-6-hydroxymethyldihydropteridine diphosphokinase